jgi:predicted exporter
MAKKAFTAMNKKELATATAQFDGDFDDSQFKSLNEEQHARWQRVKRKRGRPTVGQGARVISVSVEKGLLQRADKLAKKLKVTRAGLITKGLESMLNARPVPRLRTMPNRRTKAG